MLDLERKNNYLEAIVREASDKANFSLKEANHADKGFKIHCKHFTVQVLHELNWHSAHVWYPDQRGGGTARCDICKYVTHILAYMVMNPVGMNKTELWHCINMAPNNQQSAYLFQTLRLT